MDEENNLHKNWYILIVILFYLVFVSLGLFGIFLMIDGFMEAFK